MVTPADGPSLGVAPSGQCTCMSFSSKNAARPKAVASRRATSSASCEDSFMTLPSWPVTWSAERAFTPPIFGSATAST